MQVGFFGEIQALKTKTFIGIPCHSQKSSLRDRTGHYTAAIVINMLSYQVHTTGTEIQTFWLFLKTITELFYQFIFHSFFFLIFSSISFGPYILAKNVSSPYLRRMYSARMIPAMPP